MSAKKRIFVFFIAVLVTPLPSVSNVVYADIGPKPKVVVTFSGLEDRTFYVTLLSKDPGTGPYSAYEYSGIKDLDFYTKLSEEQKNAIGQKFYDYEDPDGYYFCNI